MQQLSQHDPITADRKRFTLPLATVVLAVCSVLIFYGLGHYPFWCDEADTALYARGVARTGDTSAVIDHNLYAYRSGNCLVNLRGRFVPPASFYVAAPFVGTNGTGSFWPRFPFAICGILSVTLILYWMWCDCTDPLLWVVFSLGLMANVSLLLYFRQCRYFGLATLLSLAASYCYAHRNERRRTLVLFSMLVSVLLFTQYLFYAGLLIAIAADYLLFGRHQRPISRAKATLIVGSQILLAIVAVSIWHPLKGAMPSLPERNLLFDKLVLLGWNFRDMNVCEYGVGMLILIAPLLYLVEKNQWLLRGPLAIGVYTLIVTLLNPQPVVGVMGADIRYLSALIPLSIFISALAIVILSRHRWLIAVPLALVAFGTNILNQPLRPAEWRSTVCQWVEELYVARTTPVQLAVNWINENVQPGQSIWVCPEFMTYALMYHAPQAVYAWQLQPPALGQFENFPPIHFHGSGAPDYVIAFGQCEGIGRDLGLLSDRGIHYRLIKTFDIYWDDLTRPELFWHSFKQIQNYDRAKDIVFILRRSDLNSGAP